MLGIYGGRGGEKTTRQTQEKGTQQSWLSSSAQHAETQNWLRAGLHDETWSAGFDAIGVNCLFLYFLVFELFGGCGVGRPIWDLAAWGGHANFGFLDFWIFGW